MSDTENVDPYSPLFALAEKRGAERLDLLSKESLVLAMRLRAKDPKRYAMLVTRLTGWTPLGQFKSEVARILTGSKRKREEEKQAEARHGTTSRSRERWTAAH